MRPLKADTTPLAASGHSIAELARLFELSQQERTVELHAEFEKLGRDKAKLLQDKLRAAAKGISGGSPLFFLSSEQQAVCDHIWQSNDRVILLRGGAGTGNTHTMRSAIAGIDKPVVVLAPSSEASRGVLRREGFAQADTVARFLQDDEFQKQARNGVVWIDEAALLGIKQMSQVFDAAERLNARVVIQGDDKQNSPIPRGSPFRVLQDYAGLPLAELKTIRRQTGDYKSAIESIQKGDIIEGYDKPDSLGWVRQVQDNAPLVDEYMKGISAKRDMLVIAPTHIEADEITATIRERLIEQGTIDTDERTFETLKPLGWTEAERGDIERYRDTDIVVQFHRNSGAFKAGSKVTASELAAAMAIRPEHFSAYSPSTLALAAGDSIRATANGWAGKHRINNGATYTIRGFTRGGDIELTNGWTLEKGFGHLDHAYVSTSYSSQGKTVDRVLIAMGGESLPAMNASQFYVSASRGRESAQVFTDLQPAVLRDAIQRCAARKSATELIGQPKPVVSPKKKRTWRDRAADVMKRTRSIYRQLREYGNGGRNEREHERDGYGGYTR